MLSPKCVFVLFGGGSAEKAGKIAYLLLIVIYAGRLVNVATGGLLRLLFLINCHVVVCLAFDSLSSGPRRHSSESLVSAPLVPLESVSALMRNLLRSRYLIFIRVQMLSGLQPWYFGFQKHLSVGTLGWTACRLYLRQCLHGFASQLARESYASFAQG